MSSATPLDWQSPLPLSQWRLLNEQSAQNVPDSPPQLLMLLLHPSIVCGPILRLAGSHEKLSLAGPNYRGLILLVYKAITDQQVPPVSYFVGSDDPSTVSAGTFPSSVFHSAHDYTFVRYLIDLPLRDYPQRVRYHVSDNASDYNTFHIPSVSQSMNIVLVLCNGFSLAVETAQYPLSLWLDVLTKHASNPSPFHVIIGGGDQIYADSVKLHSPELQRWLAEKSSHRKRAQPASDLLVQELHHYYLHHYLAWFGAGYWTGNAGSTRQPLFPVAMANIPLVNLFDDHDIIDGFGLYDHKTMLCPVLKTVGDVAYTYYMLFQHHMLPTEPAHNNDLAWILGQGQGPYILQQSHSLYMRLGRDVSLAALDCRTERTLTQVLLPQLYQHIFSRIKRELDASPDTKHLLVLLGVPIFYPRMVWLERLLNSKLLIPLRKLSQRGIISKGLVNEFDGAVEVLDDLNDHWCSHYHKRERNALVRDLLGVASSRGVRITILLGDVHLGCVARLKLHFHQHRKTHELVTGDSLQELNEDVTTHPERDPRLMFNVVSLAVTNAPPPNAMATMLARRSAIHKFDRDTDEDVVELFTHDVDKRPLANQQFLNRRNWCGLVLARHSADAPKATTAAESGEPAERRVPGPRETDLNKELDEAPSQTRKSAKDSNVHVAYPLYSDSLVATLHMEQNPKDFDAPTVGYEVLIPALVGKYKLAENQVKHL